MNRDGFLVILCCGGMELSWSYAWATFLTTAILHRPFPFPEALGTVALAAALAAWTWGRGWRVIAVLAAQAVGFLPAVLRMTHIFRSWSPFFSDQPLAGSAGETAITPDWVVFVLVSLWVLLFWVGGVKLARRPRNYSTLCYRFDIGLAAFFLLFLTFLVMVLKGAAVPAIAAGWLVGAFFVFGLLAIGLTRIGSGDPASFLPGYRGTGVILSFSVGALLTAAGAGLLCYPYLTGVAERGYGVLRVVSRPLGSLLLRFLRFLFFREIAAPEAPSRAPKALKLAGEPGQGIGWLEGVGEILAWIMRIAIGLAFLAILLAVIYTIVAWLLSKTDDARSDERKGPDLRLAVSRLFRLLRSACRRMQRWLSSRDRAAQLYAALVGWGNRSGLHCVRSDTPREYGSRLERRFPLLREEIRLIVEAYNGEVYGGRDLTREQLRRGRLALRRLCSPLLWPSRVRTWFVNGGE